MQVFESVGVDVHTGFRVRSFAWCVLAHIAKLRVCARVRVGACVRVSVCARWYVFLYARLRGEVWLSVGLHCMLCWQRVFACYCSQCTCLPRACVVILNRVCS